MKQIILFTFIFTLLLACDFSSKNRDNHPAIAPPTIDNRVEAPEEIPMTDDAEGQGISIGGIDLSFSLPQLKTLGGIKKIDDSPNNLEVKLQPNSNIEDIWIVIDESKLKDLVIEQQYENSIVIQDNDQVLPLTNWKHHTTDWEPVLNKLDKNYKTIYPEEEDLLKLPSFSEKELITYLTQDLQKGDLALSLKKPSLSTTENNWATAVSTIRLRFTGENNKGEKIEKTLNLSVPIQ